METTKVEAWQRCFDDVVGRAADWPRELWFAAVEDGIAAALGSDTVLLDDYRRDVVELLDLERQARGTYRDAKRIAQLEAQIQTLVGQADDVIIATLASPTAVPATPVPAAAPPMPMPRAMPARPAWRLGAMLASGALMLIVGVVATHLHHERQIEALRAELVGRLEGAEGLRDDMFALRSELQGNVDRFNQAMSQSVESMLALSDGAVAELERRLNSHGTDVAEMLQGLRQRAGALRRGLDEISEDLAALEGGTPRLDGTLDGLGAELQRMAADLVRSRTQIDRLEERIPATFALLEEERRALQAEVGARRAAIAGLGVQIAELDDQLEGSRALLAGFTRTIDQGLAEAKQDGASLKAVVAEMRDTGRLVGELVTTTETQMGVAQQEVQAEIDLVLSSVAERADLAVLRSEDVMSRAAVESERRLAGEADATRAALAKARQAQIAELTRQAEATRTELERTRAGLVVSWQRMDQAVAERQDLLLADLDAYADTIEARVQEFLDALDVMVAHGPAGG